MTELQTTQAQTIGEIANAHAAAAAFADYRARIAQNTKARQDRELSVFSEYLGYVDIVVSPAALATDPQAWRGITWGIVAGFVQWQLREGFAIGAINVRLSTVKAYARLAHQAGAIGADEWQLIQTVKGYSRNQARNVDTLRTTTRRSTRKVEAPSLTDDQVKALKSNHPDTPQGRRDKLLMGLLLNLGLRVSEIVGLRAVDFDTKAGTLVLYRPKVGLTQTHELINGTWDAARDYIAQDVTDLQGPLLRASNKHGTLTHTGMTRFGIAKRVQQMGAEIGIPNLSPHDCRHSWATRAAKHSDAFALRDAGGWASMAMPSRYVEAAKVANKGIKLNE